MADVTKEEVERRRLMVECSDYIPVHGHWRCSNYMEGGSCSRDDYFMCVEWQKKNPGYQPPPEPDTPESEAAAAETMGAASPPLVTGSTKDALVDPSDKTAEAYQPPKDRAGERSGAVYDLGSLGKRVGNEKRIILERPELLTEQAIEQLNKLGYEVTIKTQSGTEVTLVPAYTDIDRAEWTYRDARTLVMVLQVFPNATIESLRKPNEQEVAS